MVTHAPSNRSSIDSRICPAPYSAPVLRAEEDKQEQVMTTQDVYARLQAAGIRYHSKSYQDYETAKRLLLSETLSQLEYRRRLTAITDYVGI
jgi:hypothetical protein